MGYNETSKIFRVWVPEKRRVVISRDVFIDEITQAESKPEETTTNKNLSLLFTIHPLEEAATIQDDEHQPQPEMEVEVQPDV